MRNETLSVALTIPAVLLCATVCLADNPIIQTKYTADPDPVVYDGTVYLITSHDEDDAQGWAFKMKNWLMYTTTDMANWTDHGPVAGIEAPYNTFSWADRNSNSAWAPKLITRNGKWYLYVCFQVNGRFGIAVAVADNPFGPYVDVLGKHLIYGNSSESDYDPAPFVDDDGQAYLYWGGNPDCFYVKLNEDMISTSGPIVKVTDQLDTYQEGPEIWKHNGKYYLGWASTCCPEGIGYAMSDKPTGPWKSMGYIMQPSPNASGNSCGNMDYKGNSYVFGFSYELLNLTVSVHDERRSVSVTKITYNADGSIQTAPWWGTGAPTPGVSQLEHLNPYQTTQAETIAWALTVKTEPCSEGGMDVTAIENGDFIKVAGVDFGAGATSLDVRVASADSGGNIEVRLDSKAGKLAGTCAVSGTGSAQTWTTKSCPISGASGVHDLYFVFTGGSETNLFNFNWWKFSGSGPTVDGGGTGGQTADAGPGAGGAGGSGGGGNGGAQTGGGGAGPAGAGGKGDGGKGGSGGAVSGGTTGTAVGGSSGMQNGSGGAGGSTTSSAGGRSGSGGAAGSRNDNGTGSSGCSCDFGRSSAGSNHIVKLLACLAMLIWWRRRSRRP